MVRVIHMVLGVRLTNITSVQNFVTDDSVETAAVFIEFHDVSVNILVDTKPPLISTRITHIQPLVAFLQPENKNQEDTLLISDELYNNFVFLEISLASQTSDTNRV